MNKKDKREKSVFVQPQRHSFYKLFIESKQLHHHLHHHVDGEREARDLRAPDANEHQRSGQVPTLTTILRHIF